MNTYLVPWTISGEVEIRAETAEDAEYAFGLLCGSKRDLADEGDLESHAPKLKSNSVPASAEGKTHAGANDTASGGLDL